MTPIIGITAGRVQTSSPLPFVHISESYIRAVANNGGIPLIISSAYPPALLNDLMARLDGLLLTGGGDVDPQLFDGQPHPRVYDIDHDRDLMEIKLVRLAVKKGLPFLGICRGAQIINVALGGSLITDIGDQTSGTQRHDWFPDIPRDYLAHSVSVKSGSRLEGILGKGEVETNSLHHQAIKEPASVLKVTATAPDGIIEAVELPGHPFGLGVQWHPEWLQHIPAQQSLFRSLAEAADRK